MIGSSQQGFFMHIPKTAGESFAMLLRDAGIGEVLRIPPEEEFFPALVSIDRYKVVHGHAPYPVSGLFREPPFLMTLLRSPVERVVSAFEYLSRSDWPGHREQRRRWREQGIETIDDLISHGQARNLQTTMLGMDYDLAPLVDRFSRGELSAAEAREEMRGYGKGRGGPQALARAKERLAQFQFIGITEAFDESVRLFGKLIGKSLVPGDYRTNSAPAEQRTARRERYADSTLAAIAAANQLDQALYEFGLELFSSRYADAFGEPPAIVEADVAAPAAAVNGASAPTKAAPRRRRAAARSGSGRAPRSGALGDYKQAFFLHIPKTAGRSFGRVLRRDTALGTVLRLPPGDGLIPALANVNRHPVVHGHVPYPVTGLLAAPVLTMTFLRDPVERVVSLYEYGMRRPGLGLQERWRAAGIGNLADLGASGVASDLQVKMLGSSYPIRDLLERWQRDELSPAEARAELRKHLSDPCDRETLERAKQRLEQIPFVGITDAFDDSLRLFGKLIGMTAPPTPYGIDRAPARDRATRKARHGSDLDAVADANRLDRELYEFAVELFTGRYREAFSRPPRFGALAGGSRPRSRRPRLNGDYEQAFFLHIPKTAGRSFRRVLQRDSGLGEVLRIPHDDRAFPAIATADDYPVVQGHVAYPVAATLRHPLFMMTFLRRPVDRVVSLFEHSRRKPEFPMSQRLMKSGIDSPKELVARGIASNQQTKLLGTEYDFSELLERFKRGELGARQARLRLLQETRRDATPETLERAKARLQEMQFVGITEAFDDSLRLFSKALGIDSDLTSYRIDAASAGEQRARRSRYGEDELAAVAEANRFDLELYEFAKDLFEQRFQAAFDEPPSYQEKTQPEPSIRSA